MTITNRFFGDSMTFGANNDTAFGSLWPYIVTPWAHVLSAMRSEACDMRAVSGQTLADQAASIFAYSPIAGSRHFHLAGRADLVAYGSGAGAISQFQKSLTAMAYWLAGTKALATSGAWSYTGTWNATPFYGLGKYTQTNGATASFTITGDVLAFQHVLCDSNAATITVKSDGVVVGTFPCVGDQTIFRGGSTPIYAPALRRISGLGVGTHAIVITANVPIPAGGDDLVMLDWFWTGSNALPLRLLTNPRSAVLSDASVAAYNAVPAAVAAQAAGDGMDVALIDAGPSIDPTKGLTADGNHLANIGHLDYAGAVNARL
jgi:hypothetical protein